MLSTRALRQAAQHAERTPLIKFVGRRHTPASVDHTPQPHPASPTHSLPEGFGSGGSTSRHASFSSYRDHAQQFGPLRKSIRSPGEATIGSITGYELGPVEAPKGSFFDRNELPARFRRSPLSLAEIEAIETGGATLTA